jgi:hypothetical protein
MFHTDSPQILYAIIQNVVARAKWHPRFVQPWSTQFVLTVRKFIRSKAVDRATVIVLVGQHTETAEHHLQFVTNSKKFTLHETEGENYSKLRHVNLHCPLQLLTAGVRELHFIFGLTAASANLWTE